MEENIPVLFWRQTAFLLLFNTKLAVITEKRDRLERDCCTWVTPLLVSWHRDLLESPLALFLHPCPIWGASTSDLLVCLTKNLYILCWRPNTKMWRFQIFDTSMVYLRTSKCITITYSKFTSQLLNKEICELLLYVIQIITFFTSNLSWLYVILLLSWKTRIYSSSKG